MNIKSGIISRICLSLLFVLLFFVITHNAYRLPFSYGDDYTLLAMVHPEKAPAEYKASFYGNTPGFKGQLANDTHLGRFRPLSWTYEELMAIVCGDNTHLWRLSNLVILFFSVFFLLGIPSLLNVDRLSCLIVLAIYMFGRNNESWWTLIPPTQDIGESLLLAGMYAWLFYRKNSITGFYVLPAFIFLLAALCKESFIFCISIILIVDYLFFNPTKRLFSKEYLFSTLAAFLPFMGLLITVLHTKKIYAYPYPDALSTVLIYNGIQFIAASIFFLAPIALLFIGRKVINKGIVLKVSLVTLSWICMQLVLLKGIKLDDQHHYLIPGILLPIIVTALAFSEIKKLSKKIFNIICVIYSLAILAFAWNTYTNSSSYTASLKAYYRMLEEVNEDYHHPIVYLSDNACTGDWIIGTSLVLANMGVNTPIEFCPTIDSVPAWEEEYFRHSVQRAFKRVPFDSTLFIPDGKWILLVEDPAKNGFIKENISLYKKDENSYLRVDDKIFRIPGRFYYFAYPYPGFSLGEILRKNYASINYKGFYAIKLDDWSVGPCIH